MKTYIIGGIILLALVAGVITWIRQDAAQDVLDKVERKNNELGNRSDDSRSEFDLCPPGMWDYGSRECKQPSTNRRN